MGFRGFKMSSVQQNTSDETFYSIKIEINNSTTSFNKDRSITLMSKDENCEELIKMARKLIEG